MSDANGKRTARKATEAERRKINRLLDEFCIRDSGTEDEPGECHYINGETDASIARKISPELSEASVSKIRREIFGNFHKPPKPPRQPDAELRAKVDQLHAAVGVLSTALLALALSYNRYMSAINEDSRSVSTAWEKRLWAEPLPAEAPPPVPESFSGGAP